MITDDQLKLMRDEGFRIAADEIAKMQAAMALAYGYLWHVNNEPAAPIPLYSPEKAAYEARKLLRDTMTHEQRGVAINRVQALLGDHTGCECL